MPLADDEYWLTWLEEHHAFSFHGCNGQLNLLKEKRHRGSEGYWYAYQRQAQGMVKRYAGRSRQLSLYKLEEIATQFTNEQAAFATVGAELVSAPTVANAAPRSDAAQRANDASLSIQVEPLLMTKLQLPRLQRSLLRRESLLTLLDQSLEHTFTLISGPAGYGKTTLVGQWITERSTRANFPHIVSVTLDEGDNDPIRFWRYVIAAIQQKQPNLGQEALELLQAHQLLPYKPLEMMLTALLNALSQLEHPIILLLEDFHVIKSSPVITTLYFFLDHLPTSFHIIMLIRGDPPFPLARWRARNELLEIHPPQLCFSLDETRAFFKQELSIPLSDHMLRHIHERIDGWPTGMRLLAKSLQWPDNEQEVLHKIEHLKGSDWSFQEYFLNEVLHIIPAALQDFLLQTCFLPRVTSELCDTIMQRTDSAQLIETLRASDFFLIPLDSIGKWTRYHSLFAEAMQQEAQKRIGEEHLRLLAERASRWFEEHGLLAEAIETTLHLADFPQAASLIEDFITNKQQTNIFAVPDLYTLHNWLKRLPEAELECHPNLCVQYAMTLLFFLTDEGSHIPHERERIHYLLQVAEQQWHDTNNTAKLAEIFAFRALLVRREGKILQAITWARQSLAWLPEQDRTWRNLDLTVVGMGEILEGDLTHAREFLLEALAISEQQNNRIYARATRGMLGGVSLEQGLLRSAAEQFRQQQAEARVQKDRDDIARTQLCLSQIAYQWNNLDEAEQAACEALEIGKQMQVEELLALATLRLAWIEHARGQIAQAQQRLISWLAQEPAPKTPFSYQLSRQVQATQARFHLANGERAAVERWFASSSKQRIETLPRLQRQREQLLQARLFLAQGKHTTAIEQLENLRVVSLQTGHLDINLEIQLVLVLAYARLGEQKQVQKQLHELLRIAHSENYQRLFLDEGSEIADLLRRLLPQLREKALLDYARRLLNAFAHEVGAQPTHPDMQITSSNQSTAFLAEPLSAQEQKVLRLLAAGNSNAEIARELVVSVNTIRTQLQSIYRKLNVNNRVAASAIANQLELL
jgi:LuxR family maltose regulon positive regulatory protein